MTAGALPPPPAASDLLTPESVRGLAVMALELHLQLDSLASGMRVGALTLTDVGEDLRDAAFQVWDVERQLAALRLDCRRRRREQEPQPATLTTGGVTS
jgi:hypothetical protein